MRDAEVSVIYNMPTQFALLLESVSEDLRHCINYGIPLGHDLGQHIIYCLRWTDAVVCVRLPSSHWVLEKYASTIGYLNWLRPIFTFSSLIFI